MPEATIRDVAKRAHLSVATVSRALNGFENVSENARERITEAVKELGYVPHAGARSLSLARNNAIGVVLPDLHGEFFSEIVRGMDRAASKRRTRFGRCAGGSTDSLLWRRTLVRRNWPARCPAACLPS
jgi:LacI family transcriptional regulator